MLMKHEVVPVLNTDLKVKFKTPLKFGWASNTSSSHISF